MSQSKRILIVGGVAGGASAAARARRLDENARIILFERGQYISFANCGLPYHVGGVIADRDRLLVQTPDAFRSRFRVDVRVHSEVTAIDRHARTVTVRPIDGPEYSETYDALVLSPGAEPVRPPIPGADSPGVFTLRNMADMDAIINALESDQTGSAIVVGGGYIGLEMAENLRHRGLDVNLVELDKQVLAPADPEMAHPLHQQLRLHGVALHLQASVTAIEPRDGRLAVQLSTGDQLEAGLVILAVGVRPETKLARDAGLTIGPRGGIAVDSHMRTADPAIYAVGDAIEIVDLVTDQPALVPLAGPANRQGRIAADNIAGRDSSYRNTQGTAICKVFDLAIGMTGANEKTLLRLGRNYEKVYIHPSSHAGYYPGAHPLSLKLLFDPADGRVLGAQAVGADGIDKRIDVLATAIRAGMTVEDLEHLELSYAPPYGSAKDPVNYAGFVANNARRGDVGLCHVPEVVDPPAGSVLLDVRTPAEIDAGAIPNALNIPLDELRDRLEELPRDREILAICAVGLRGYLACRILSQHGFKCRNLSGGYRTYAAVLGLQPERTETRKPAKDRKTMTTPDDTASCCGAPRAATAATAATAVAAPAIVRHVDATGLQCPGPIMRLRNELDSLEPGQALTIASTDPGFAADVPAWCESTGHQLLDLVPDRGAYRATIVKADPAAAPQRDATGKTIVVFSNDFDKAMAAFIIANGAAATGRNVTLFFTFWGLNLLRRPGRVATRKTLVERMFGWMMPRGAARTTLSKMHMAGMGTAMIKSIMRQKNVASLDDLIGAARASGVRLVACAMSMDLMGIRPEELIDGVETGGVAMYLNQAENSNVNLFI